MVVARNPMPYQMYRMLDLKLHKNIREPLLSKLLLIVALFISLMADKTNSFSFRKNQRLGWSISQCLERNWPVKSMTLIRISTTRCSVKSTMDASDWITSLGRPKLISWWERLLCVGWMNFALICDSRRRLFTWHWLIATNSSRLHLASTALKTCSLLESLQFSWQRRLKKFSYQL